MEPSSPRIFGVKSYYRRGLFTYSYFDEGIACDRDDSLGVNRIMMTTTAESDASSTAREEFI